MKNASDFHFDVYSGLHKLERLPRGWVLIAACLMSWLIVAGCWAAISALFPMLLAMV